MVDTKVAETIGDINRTKWDTPPTPVTERLRTIVAVRAWAISSTLVGAMEATTLLVAQPCRMRIPLPLRSPTFRWQLRRCLPSIMDIRKWVIK